MPRSVMRVFVFKGVSALGFAENLLEGSHHIGNSFDAYMDSKGFFRVSEEI